MKETLYNKIFKMYAILVLVSTLVLLFVVWNSTSKSITQNVENQLEVAETVVVRELISRQTSILQNTKVLIDDFSFKRAIAAGNERDLKQALDSYRNMLDAAFFSIHKANDSFQVSSGNLQNYLSEHKNLQGMYLAKEDGDSSNLLVLNNKLTWVLWLPIKENSGEIFAYASMGFIIGKPYLNSIKHLTSLDISIHVKSDKYFVVSTLPKKQSDLSYLEDSVLQHSSSIWEVLGIFGDHNTLLSRKFIQAQIGEVSNDIYLSADASALRSSFLTLQLTIGAISLVTLLIAMLTGRLLAKQITKPIEYIADYAEDISKGNYSKGIELQTCSLELDQLLRAFKAMEQGVKRRETEIVYQAKHDMLTSLYNRNYFTEHLDELFASKHAFQAIAINIKGFRGINDVFGYQYGDMLLQELAARIYRLGGTSARVSGGEILWIPEEPLRLPEIERIKERLEADIVTANFTMPFKTTIGIVNCPSDTQNSEDLYRRLNIAIDEAQFATTLMVEFTNTFENRYLRRLAIINKLKKALKEGSKDLSLHYQPKLNLMTNQVTKVEALIRWIDKELGFIPPDEFIEVAEQAGLINKVTFWVITRAVEDLQAFKKQGLDLSIAINISAQDLLNEQFIIYTTQLLSNHGLSTRDISFELTESVIVEEPEKAIAHMQELKDAGFSLAIDDFGKGYSSLSYVTQLPVDTIKIDKCFVIPLAKQVGEQSICKAVLSLAKSFDMCVVAEGVEDFASMQLLNQWGCNYAQGYFISRPISSQDLVSWMQAKLKNKQELVLTQ